MLKALAFPYSVNARNLVESERFLNSFGQFRDSSDQFSAMNTRSIQRALNGGVSGSHNGAEFSREPCMRIGSEFQVNIPTLQNNNSGQSNGGTGSVLVWSPSNQLRDEDVDAYVTLAKDQFGYTIEQALGLLYWHKYSIERAVQDLPNFQPLQEEWSMEDKVIFEQAFQYHGKNFQRIRAMLPDKPISSLVKYYYLWKRSYAQFSLMDKQSRRNGKRLNAGLPVTNDDADSTKSGSSRSDSYTAPTFPAPILLTSKGKQLPRGIYLSTAELLDLESDTERVHLRLLDHDIDELRSQLQKNKQDLVQMKETMGGVKGVESLRPAEFSRKTGSAVPTRWSEEEIEIALEVIQKHGKDYEAMSNALEGKTIPQCKNFFTNYKRKLNLPKLIAEYEIKHGQKLSRYSRQAKELLENGGPGLGEDDIVADVMMGPSHSKRPRLQHGGEGAMEMGEMAF